MANEPKPQPDALRPEQRSALTMILAGKSVIQAAEALEISRGTVHRWLRESPAFRAAFNAWQNELEESCRARLLALTDTATSAIQKALEAGDARLAMKLLQKLGLIKPNPKPRPTDPADIAKHEQAAERKRKAAVKEDLKEAEDAETRSNW
jgi:hypothetical protein